MAVPSENILAAHKLMATPSELIEAARNPLARQELAEAKDVVAAARARSQVGENMMPPPDVSGDADFTSAIAFLGARAGFVFKNGEKGLGYYRDSVAAVPKKVESSRLPKQRPKDGPLSSGPVSGPLTERWTFEQTPTEATLLLRGLPSVTKATDIKVASKFQTLSLSVSGEQVLDVARLHLPCVPDETDFTLHDVTDGVPPFQFKSRTLAVNLTKHRLPGAPPWPTLLETVEMS